MKQHPKSRNCIAVCAAMATNTTLKDVWKTIGKQEEYSDCDIYLYLMLHGVYAGAIFRVEREGVKTTSSFKVKVSPKDGPALVYVKSERTKHDLHAIYWDGTSVHDPNPLTKDNRPLSSYKIDDWVPLTPFQRNGCLNSNEFNMIEPAKKKKKKNRRKT